MDVFALMLIAAAIFIYTRRQSFYETENIVQIHIHSKTTIIRAYLKG